ncbi:MAG: hypothetical protein K2F79_07055, partial [Muribaculaceae bacterium]|nr:hypothetical protein [Muribaculaceae bacterium]
MKASFKSILITISAAAIITMAGCRSNRNTTATPLPHDSSAPAAEEQTSPVAAIADTYGQWTDLKIP